VADTDADVVACYPYLFATTVDAIAVSKVPTVLHPAAHDEPALYLSVLPPELPGHRRIRLPHPGRTGADGVRVRHRSPPRSFSVSGSTMPAGAGRRGGGILGIGDRPYLCYLGRVDEHKGCGMLAEYFEEYKERHPSDLALAFVGPVSDNSSSHPDIVVTGNSLRGGQVGHPGRCRCPGQPVGLRVVLAGAPRVVDVGVPVLVNAACAATMEHCRRSGGGLWFDSYRSFEVSVDRLAADRGLPTAAGGGGAAVYRPLLPVALDHRPLRRDSSRGGGPGPEAGSHRTRRLTLEGAGREYVREG
jgi:hypothetical protein